jgi:hypothetical protein
MSELLNNSRLEVGIYSKSGFAVPRSLDRVENVSENVSNEGTKNKLLFGHYPSPQFKF